MTNENDLRVLNSCLAFRLVSAGWGDEEEKFFKTDATDLTNGCFLCVMKREVREREIKEENNLFSIICSLHSYMFQTEHSCFWK